MKCTQFVGAACRYHGPYVFYKAVKIFKHGKFKLIGLGEFFFIRISPLEDPCIGELQLLWEDKSTERMLASVRLYFLPEQTPEGRKSHHGEHEVVAASERVVLRLEDLRTWMTEEVSWCHGLVAPWSQEVKEAPQDGPLSAKAHALGPQHLDAIKDTKDLTGAFLDKQNLDLEDHDQELNACTEDGNVEAEPAEEHEVQQSSSSTCVLVLSYPRYCRYRGILKRLNGLQNTWLKNTLVVALGGFALPCSNGRVLFCRDTFEHDGLLQNDLHCEYLAPTLKGKPRIKKKVKVQGRSQSPGSESNASEDSKETTVKAQVSLYEANNGKKPACKEEQEFLQKLFKFMQERHTPIHRVPHLGFKQIDLHLFYSCAQRLGGYDAITCKKMWKHVYDEMGGNPGSTSAATCTRRHYERLLLPFERYTNGEEDSPIMIVQPQQPVNAKEQTFLETRLVLERQDSAESCKTEDEDIKPESPLEAAEGECPPSAPAETDLMPLRPPVTPILVDLETESCPEPINNQTEQKKRIRDTAISEKERKWNEIRRKTAMARNWARQLRPVKPVLPEYEQDVKIMNLNVRPPMVADCNKAPPRTISPMSFHSSYHHTSNKHSTWSAMPSTKCTFSHMTPPTRDQINCSTHPTYQSTQPYHHRQHHYYHHQGSHQVSTSKSQLPVSTDTSNSSLPNGVPSSKDCLYQRRPSVIQHTEKICSPPLPNHPMPAHLSSLAVEAAHLRNDSSNTVMFHPAYDSNTRPTNCITGTSVIGQKANSVYAQVQQSRRQYFASMYKEKSQARSGVRPVLDLTGKCQPPSPFSPALTPSTPAYCRGSLRVQDSSPCEAEVLDLSVKSRKESTSFNNKLSISLPEKKVSLTCTSSEECLDLSIKKRKTSIIDLSDEARGIENVTPPSPVSRSVENEEKIILMPPMKSPITSLSLLRSATIDKVQLPQKDGSNMTPPAYLPPVLETKPTFLVEDVQAAAQHSIGKPLYVSDYNPPLPQFITPSPVYPPTTIAWPQNLQSTMDHSQNNLSTAYKDLMDHGVFSRPLPYSLAQRLYPLLYKEGNGFPTFSK